MKEFLTKMMGKCVSYEMAGPIWNTKENISISKVTERIPNPKMKKMRKKWRQLIKRSGYTKVLASSKKRKKEKIQSRKRKVKLLYLKKAVHRMKKKRLLLSTTLFKCKKKESLRYSALYMTFLKKLLKTTIFWTEKNWRRKLRKFRRLTCCNKKKVQSLDLPFFKNSAAVTMKRSQRKKKKA